MITDITEISENLLHGSFSVACIMKYTTGNVRKLLPEYRFLKINYENAATFSAICCLSR